MMAAINTASGNTSVTAPTAVKSPRQAGDGVGSPQSRRSGGRAAAGASPWTQIVRGESEPIAAEPTVAAGASASSSPPSSSSSSPPPPPPLASSSPSLVEDSAGESSESGNAGKKHAWNKPSNGGSEVGPVMGAESWPALGESARVSTKSSSESLKGLSDGLSSISLSPVSGTTISSTSSPQKQVHTTSTPNQPAPVRPTRSMRPRNNPNASSNGVLPQQQAPAGLVNETASSIHSPRDHTQRSGVGSQSHSGGDHPQQRNSFRNRSGGPNRGDASHNHNYGGRRDQDRGNHDWNSNNRSFNGRESHIPQPRVMPRVYRGQTPSPGPASFIPNHGMRPYGPHPIPFPGELGPQLVYIAHPPFIPPIQPVFMPPSDPQLPSKIVHQIDFYFSNENLIKDTYLRKNMDDQGWVPIKLIAGFNKVVLLTDNIPFILEALRMSNVVEVQGDKVRKRNDWKRWILPTAVRASPEERNTNFGGSGQSYQPQFPNGDAAGQFGVQAGSDRSFSGRN